MASFTDAHRLHHKREFDLVYRGGRRHSDVHFLIIAKRNDLEHPRLGMSVAAKAVGQATNRNRVKRVIRESFRHFREQMPALDIVVNARAGARAASNADLTRSLAQLWDKLARYG